MNGGDNNPNQKEFRKWFMEMKDPTQDKCKINSSTPSDNISKRIKSSDRKSDIINVVKCSTGKGRWNYKAKVIKI